MAIGVCPFDGEQYGLPPGTECPIHKGYFLESFLMQGTLRVIGTQSMVNGVLLARSGNPDPFGAATNLVVNAGCADGDTVDVQGAMGFIGGVEVFFVDSVQRGAIV